MSEPDQKLEIPQKVSRRNMLMTLGIALNAVAGILFAVPVVGYILGPAKRKEMKKELVWIPAVFLVVWLVKIVERLIL